MINHSDIKTNDLVGFLHILKKNPQYYIDYISHKTGIILNNDISRGVISIKWFGQWGDGNPPWWHSTSIKYEHLEQLDFSKIGVSKYETVYKPAFFGLIVVYGFVYLFGAFISGIIGTIALGFGGAMAFILAKNFKRIKNFKIKKNVTILSPVKEEPNNDVYGVKIVPLVDDPKLKLINRDFVRDASLEAIGELK